MWLLLLSRNQFLQLYVRLLGVRLCCIRLPHRINQVFGEWLILIFSLVVNILSAQSSSLAKANGFR